MKLCLSPKKTETTKMKMFRYTRDVGKSCDNWGY